MPTLDLRKSRDLRSRAEKLLGYLGKDLHPFLQNDGLTFRRTPDSRRDSLDVNVTTTCSCLMALTLTNRLEEFYVPNEKEEARTQIANGKVSKAFRKVVDAPWMSSGLTENNAFTTTLV